MKVTGPLIERSEVTYYLLLTNPPNNITDIPRKERR